MSGCGLRYFWVTVNEPLPHQPYQRLQHEETPLRSDHTPTIRGAECGEPLDLRLGLVWTRQWSSSLDELGCYQHNRKQPPEM